MWVWVLVWGSSFSPQQWVVEAKDKTWCPGREVGLSRASLHAAKLKSPAAEEDLVAAQHRQTRLVLLRDAFPQGSGPWYILQAAPWAAKGGVVYVSHRSCALECGEKNCPEMTLKRLVSCAKDLERKASLR